MTLKKSLRLAKNADKLLEIVSTTARAAPRIGIFSLSHDLSEKINLDLSEVILIVRGLANLHGARDGLSVTGEELARTVARSLEQADATDTIKAWKDGQAKIIQALNALTGQHPLVVSFAAGSAAFSIPNVVLSMELSTETRPVFSESKDRILFTIIHHTLSLEYHEGYRRHKEIHLSLDARDIETLRAICEQAEQATATLKASIPGPSAVPWENDVEDTEK